MYIHHHRGIIPPPIPWGGVGTRDTGPLCIYIYHVYIYMYTYIYIRVLLPNCSPYLVYVSNRKVIYLHTFLLIFGEPCPTPFKDDIVHKPLVKGWWWWVAQKKCIKPRLPWDTLWNSNVHCEVYVILWNGQEIPILQKTDRTRLPVQSPNICRQSSDTQILGDG